MGTHLSETILKMHESIAHLQDDLQFALQMNRLGFMSDRSIKALRTQSGIQFRVLGSAIALNSSGGLDPETVARALWIVLPAMLCAWLNKRALTEAAKRVHELRLAGWSESDSDVLQGVK